MYNISYFGFGQMNFESGEPSSAYYAERNNISGSAVFALDYVGLGVPKNGMRWFEQKLQHISQFVNESLSCDYSLHGGNCTLSASCETFADLWTYSFKIQFNESDNYLVVPFAAIAVDNWEFRRCDLAISPILPGDQAAPNVILGSMFFSLYEALFEYDYTNKNQSISLALSANNTLKGSYIGNGIYSEAPNPFNGNNNSSDSITSLGIIIGAVVFGLILLIAFSLAIYCCTCKKDQVSDSDRNEILYSPQNQTATNSEYEV